MSTATLPTINPTGVQPTFPFKGIALDKAPAFPAPTEVLASKHLVAVDVLNNGNQFYDLYLEAAKPPQSWRRYRLRVHYGRVGTAGVQFVYAHGAKRADAESAFNLKIAELTAPNRINSKGEKGLTYSDHGIVRPADGQAKIIPAQAGNRAVSIATIPVAAGTQIVAPAKPIVVDANTARKNKHLAPATWDPRAKAFFDTLMSEATASIATALQASNVSSAGLMTPLGMIDDKRIAEAIDVLNQIESAISRFDMRQAILLNQKFFQLVPTAHGSAVIDSLIGDANAVGIERQALTTARNLIEMQTTSYTLPVTLEPVSQQEIDGLITLLRANGCTCSQHQREMKTLAPKQAFKVIRPDEIKQWQTVKATPAYAATQPMLLMHGTRREMAAGILTRGLLTRKESGQTGGGSVYGDGIYFANNSGKALGYTGGAGVGNRILFVTYVMMSRPQIYRGRVGGGGFTREHNGTDGVWAKNDGALLHDEWIVDSPKQTAIAYVVEV